MKKKLIKKGLIAMVILVLVGLPVYSGGKQESQKQAAGEAKSIVVAINEAPWLPGFRALAKKYEQETGVKIDIRAFPFGTLIERALNAAMTEKSEFDIVTMNESIAPRFYDGGLLTPLKEIDPNYQPDKEILEYSGLSYWNKEKKETMKEGGILYSLPINGNIQIFYYRKDLYDAAGLPAPKTWDDVMAAADKLQDKSKNFYGYSIRGQKATLSISWDWYPFLRSCGGDIFKNAPNDYTVTLNTPEARKALEVYKKLASQYSPPNVANIGQSEQIALLSSGQLLQTVVVAGAFAQMDDPKSSSVPFKIGYTVVPSIAGGKHAVNTGVLCMGIPHNAEKGKKADSLNFLKWCTSKDSQQFFAENGGVPIRSDAMDSKGKKELRFLDAVAASAASTVSMPRIPIYTQIDSILESRLNEYIAGSLTTDQVMEFMQKEVTDVMKREGYIK
jgi:multiple sugar transport system substrate-binding protein